MSILGMATRYSKGKLSEIQEKKAKMGLKEGLLSKKQRKDNEPSKGDIVVASPVTQLVLQRPTSPTLSLELIAPFDEVVKTQRRDKVVLDTFWDNVDAAVLKAHNAISVEDLKPLVTRTSQQLMSSHVHKVMQVSFLFPCLKFLLAPSLFSFFFFFNSSLFVPKCWVNLYTLLGNTWIKRRSLQLLSLRWIPSVLIMICSKERFFS